MKNICAHIFVHLMFLYKLNIISICVWCACVYVCMHICEEMVGHNSRRVVQWEDVAGCKLALVKVPNVSPTIRYSLRCHLKLKRDVLEDLQGPFQLYDSMIYENSKLSFLLRSHLVTCNYIDIK